MAMHSSVAQHLDEIRELAAEYGVEKLEIFGSAMTDEFDPDRSDVDFIVHYSEGYVFGPFGARLFDLENALTETLGRSAQLVMTKALQRDYFRASANKTRKTIYVASTTRSPVERSSETLRVPG